MSMRRNRNGVKRERIIMLVSSALVLTALTVTGVFVRSNRQKEDSGNVVDFSVIENSVEESAENVMPSEDLGTLFTEVGTDDLDYDPYFQEANSDKVENAGLGKTKEGDGKSGEEPDAKLTSEKSTTTENGTTIGNSTAAENGTTIGNGTAAENGTAIGNGTAAENDTTIGDGTAAENSTAAENGTMDEKNTTSKKSTLTRQQGESDAKPEGNGGKKEDTEAIATNVQPVLDFTEEDRLVWPIVGDILINYSMDKTIYFPTLKQYKYHPAIVISANVGESIAAAAEGRVVSVSYDPQLGNTVVMDLGNQYELTYGQLENITVSEGSYVVTGDIIGDVASPTKYYSTEGANVYFKLTKDGEPVNPMSRLKD